MFRRSPIFLNILLFIFTLPLAASIQITGTVRDLNTRRPIENVNITLQQSGLGTMTNTTGEYRLTIPDSLLSFELFIRHIAYHPVHISIDSIQSRQTLYMQPRIIPLPAISVGAEKQGPDIGRDLPQVVTLIRHEDFELRGFTDIGDLLTADQSVQVSEELSGEKGISIRGGNAEDVLILYDGVPLNSTVDHQYNLGLLDLEGVQQLELIKGSNTALYGPGGMSGVISIVPKIEQDYSVRFQQKIGTYNMGSWGLYLYRQWGPLQTYVSRTLGSSERGFSGGHSQGLFLKNWTQNQVAHIAYQLNELSVLRALYMHNSAEYNNERDRESLKDSDQIVSLKFQGELPVVRSMLLGISLHALESDQTAHLNSLLQTRKIQDASMQFHAEKEVAVKWMSMIMAYQYTRSDLEYEDPLTQSSLFKTSLDLSRNQKGLAVINKFHFPTGLSYQSSIDFDISYRFDQLRDESAADLISDRNWRKSTVKFAAQISGVKQDFAFEMYAHTGSNVRFPTLFQQVSQTVDISGPAQLEAETSLNQEIGFEMTRTLRQAKREIGLRLGCQVFKNMYDNKLVTYYAPGMPIALYDNRTDVDISGLETTMSYILMKKKVTFTFGYSGYKISDKQAFPFKSSGKAIFDVDVNHAGFKFLLHVFYEGEQTGWYRMPDGFLAESLIPSETNLDVHFSKAFMLRGTKMMGNASMRNVLSSNVELYGIALRDRRYYLTFGIQY